MPTMHFVLPILTIMLALLTGCGGGGGLTDPNTKPTAANMVVNCARSGTVAAVIVATDADGDALTYSVRTLPAHGTLTLSGATATYTNTEAAATDACAVTVSDARGGTTVVEIAVTFINSAPTIVAGQLLTTAVRVNESITRTIATNDVDGDSVLITSASAATLGALTPGISSFSYVAGTASGSDLLSLRPDDQVGGVGTAVTFIVQVMGAHDPLLADSLRITSFPGGGAASMPEVADPEGGTMTFSLSGAGAAAGTIEITPGVGGFTYAVAPDCPPGTYQVRVRATDPEGHVSNVLLIIITVVPLVAV